MTDGAPPPEAQGEPDRVEEAGSPLTRREGHGPSGLFRFVGVVLFFLILVMAGVVASRWVDRPLRPLALLQSLVPLAEILLVVLVLLTWALRHTVLAIVGAVPALVAAVLFGTPYVPHTVAPSSRDLTIFTANLEFGGADTARLYAAVSEQRTDVLILVEVTAPALARVDAAGLKSLLPFSAGSPDTGASGTVIRSRFPLTLLSSGEGSAGLTFGFRQPAARVERPGAPFVVKAVHPLPPTGWVGPWYDVLGRLADYERVQPTSVPLVLAGDFNATEDHPAYRRVAAGMVDVRRAAGGGWGPTWPHDSDIPPFVQLDHVLVRGFEPVAAGTVVLGNTDHAAVWARIQ